MKNIIRMIIIIVKKIEIEEEKMKRRENLAKIINCTLMKMEKENLKMI